MRIFSDTADIPFSCRCVWLFLSSRVRLWIALSDPRALRLASGWLFPAYREGALSCRFAVETAVADRFGDVGRRDPDLSGQIGDRSGYFDDAVVSPGRKVHAFHGTAQHGFRFGRQRTECADLLASHRGVAMNRQSGESGLLCRPGRDDPEPDRCAALLGSLAVEFGKAERRNVHVQVM